MVDKSFRIIELVVHLQFFDTSLDSEDIADHIIETIEDRMKADPKNWRAVMFDRASTNKSAINKISTRTNISPLPAYCVSHGTSSCAKKMKYEMGRKLLSHFTKMVAPRLCKARALHKTAFGESAKKSSGVRFGVEFEHASQVHRLGVKKMRDVYVKPCVEKSYSLKSAEKAIAHCKEPENLCQIICEIAAVVDIGLPLNSATYTSESDAPIILVEDEILSKLNDLMTGGVEEFNFPELENSSECAANMMKSIIVSPLFSFTTNVLTCVLTSLFILMPYVFSCRRTKLSRKLLLLLILTMLSWKMHNVSLSRWRKYPRSMR